MQYGISALVSQTSFRVETSGGVAKCRLFPQEMVSFSIDDGDSSENVPFKMNSRFFQLFVIIPIRRKCKM